MNLGQRIKQASKSLYLTDSVITLRSLCQELAHLGPIQIKYKLELNHVIRITVKKHVFAETKLTYLRVTSTCSQYIVAVNSKLGRTKDKESSYLCGSKNNNVEKKVAENWAHTVRFVGRFVMVSLFLGFLSIKYNEIWQNIIN